MNATHRCIAAAVVLLAGPWSAAAVAEADLQGGREGYVEGSGTVNSLACYEIGGRGGEYPAGVREAQRDIVRNPRHPFAQGRLDAWTRACGPLPQLYTLADHEAWLDGQAKKNATFRAAYEGSERQQRDQALLRLVEPAARGDAPGAHTCNQDEQQQYVAAKRIVERGEAGGFSRQDVEGSRLTIELIEHRCGTPPARGAAAAEDRSEEFPMSNRGWSATLLEVVSPDSASAAALGVVKRSNAVKYCERDPGGQTGGTPEGIARCVDDVLAKERGKRHVILANCARGTIKTSHMGSFVFTDVFEDEQGFPVYPWRHAETGEVLGGGMASGGDTVDAQFALVCPSYKTW